MRRLTTRPIPILAAVLVAAGLLSLLAGRSPLAPPGAALSAIAWRLGLWPQTPSPGAALVVLSVRLPRVAAAMLVGAGLSVSGAAFQGVFRNPLVAPDLLGVSTGAGLGAAVGILLGLSQEAVQLLAFVFGLLAVASAYGLASWRAPAEDWPLRLVLSGVIVGMVFTAGISLAKSVADPDDALPAITFWLMGSLAQARGDDVLRAAPAVCLSLLGLHLLRHKLNALCFGDDEARALGVDTRPLRLCVIAFSTLATAACVALAGVVGLVGLAAPHMARLLVGANFRTLLPASALFGALFLLLADDLARLTFATEIPLGVLTALLGAPAFAWLLSRLRGGWG